MEQRPEPEYLAIHCTHCGELCVLSDQSTHLQLYTQGNFMKYSFAIVRHGDCEPMYKFIDPEDAHTMGYLTNITVSDRPEIGMLSVLQTEYKKFRRGEHTDVSTQEVIEVPAEAEAWGQVMFRFLRVYKPEAWEFK